MLDKKVLLKDDEPATPCGLVAKSFFTDHYDTLTLGKTKPVFIDDKKIAWATDLEYKFKNVQGYKKADGTEKPASDKEAWKDVQWIDMKNEHFVVWMRYAGLPTFRKLWGKIVDKKKDGAPMDLEAGDYSIRISSGDAGALYDVKPFEGKKSIVFSTTNSLGGKSNKLAVCFFIAGAFTALYFCFLLYKLVQSKKAKTNV